MCTVEQCLDYLVNRAIRAKFFGEDPNKAILSLIPADSNVFQIRCRNSILDWQKKVVGKVTVQISYPSGVLLRKCSLESSAEVTAMYC